MMNDRLFASFSRIHADDGLKQRTCEAVMRRARKKNGNRPYGMLAAAASFLIAVCVSGAVFWSYITPVAAVSIDADTSYELSVNRFGRVISADEFGADTGVVSGLAHLTCEEAVQKIMEICEGEEISVTVAGEEENCRRLGSDISGCTGIPEQEIHCGSTAEAEAAHEAGMSLGKYRMYLLLEETGISAEEVQEMRMCDLRGLLSEGGGHHYRHGGGK